MRKTKLRIRSQAVIACVSLWTMSAVAVAQDWKEVAHSNDRGLIVETGVGQEGRVFFETEQGIWVEDASEEVVLAIPLTFEADGRTFSQISPASPNVACGARSELVAQLILEDGEAIVRYTPARGIEVLADTRAALPGDAPPPDLLHAPRINAGGEVAFATTFGGVSTLWFAGVGLAPREVTRDGATLEGARIVNVHTDDYALTDESALYFLASFEADPLLGTPTVVYRWTSDDILGDGTERIVGRGDTFEGLRFPVVSLNLRGVSPRNETLVLDVYTQDPVICDPDYVPMPGEECTEENGTVWLRGDQRELLFLDQGTLDLDPGSYLIQGGAGVFSIAADGTSALFLHDVVSATDPSDERRVARLYSDGFPRVAAYTGQMAQSSSGTVNAIISQLYNVHCGDRVVFLEGYFESGDAFLLANVPEVEGDRFGLALVEGDVLDVGVGENRTFGGVERLRAGGAYAGMARNVDGEHFATFVGTDSGRAAWTLRGAVNAGGRGEGGGTGCAVSGGRGGAAAPVVLLLALALLAWRRRR